jgi:hypothetical protein
MTEKLAELFNEHAPPEILRGMPKRRALSRA